MLMFTEPAKELILRDYQLSSVEGLREGIRQGRKRQILCAPTGAGKTVIAAHLLKQAHEKDSYALFVVDRVSLVDQTSQTLDAFGIPHGIIQGTHPRYNPWENVQVCSIQSLANRTLPRAPSLIIYDEAHCQYKSILQYIEQNPDAVVVGLTATPFTAGMGQFWGGMVNVTTTRKLVDEGFLIEPEMFVAKSPDDKEFSLNGYGEFSDASTASAGIEIVGDVVSEWIGKTHEHFGGPAKTIVFSPTVEHGREVCQAFSGAGFNFQQISYHDRDEDERRAKIEEFRRPNSSIHGLVSCGVLTKGFDVPDVRIGISCKPYRKSLSSHLQEVGRVMRRHPDKDKALWLDHSGNVERFALDMFDVWDNGAGELSKSTKRDSTPRERGEAQREAVVCPECRGTMRGVTCTSCGWEKPPRSNINAVAGELREFDRNVIQSRAGLRADCVKDPRKVWDAALSHCMASTRKGEDAARKWAFGIWKGVYPNAQMPSGWYRSSRPVSVDQSALSLIEREVKRFRKGSRRKSA